MKKLILSVAMLGTLFSAKAQDFEQYLAFGKDAGTIMESYLQPAFEGTIYNLNGGWYRTAKTHKLFGFDIAVNLSGSIVSDDKKTFTFDENNYSNLTLTGDPELPNFFGGDTDAELIFTQEGEVEFGGQKLTGSTSKKFKALDGYASKLNLVPAAMIQAGIGLPKKTELTFRFVPKSLVSDDKFEAGLFGVGLKHNILQYFPIAKRIPLVDVSVFGGFTNLKAEYIPSGIDGANQSVDMTVNSYTAQLLGSVDLKIVNFFVGLGYSGGSSELNVNGSYEFEYTFTRDVSGVAVSQDITNTLEGDDLPKLAYDVKSVMATAGMSINLMFFKIYGSYTLQEYNTVNAGVSFSFR